MRGATIRVAVLGLLAVPTLAPAPAPALPIGPPTVHLTAIPTDEWLSYELVAEASDPDGAIHSISICVDEGSRFECHFRVQPGQPLSDVTACLEGSEESFGAAHTFLAPGVYTVRARATGGGCPVLGSEETTETSIEVVVPAPPPPPDPIACADEGTPFASDTGVTEDAVHVGVVVSGPDGPGAARGILAAAAAINESGGICDRVLEVEIGDDGGSAEAGEAIVDGFIAGGKFALVAMPATDTLVTTLPSIEEAGMPVVGALGGAREEFGSTSVWPAGAPNADIAAVAVRLAFEQGSRRFALVYDADARFGGEIREGMRAAVADLTGAEIVVEQGLVPSRSSYSSEIQAFNRACVGTCDTVVYALWDRTMLTWITGRPQRGRLSDELAPQLFSTWFASNCGVACQGMRAWVDFQPPVGAYGAGVDRYADDVRRLSPLADPNDRLQEATWAGTMVLARALAAAGTDLTRARLRTVLNSVPIDLGVTGAPLSWGSVREANHFLRAYGIVVAAGTFAGWRDETGWIDARQPAG